MNRGLMMKMTRHSYKATLILVFCFLVQACNNYDPVPKSQCTKVVKHAKKILGSFAPKHSQMVKDCKSATDSERGCIMAATKKGQVAQCL